MRRNLLSLIAAASVGLFVAAAATNTAGADETQTITTQSWSWDGVTGNYNLAQVRRGFQVYHEICSNCHSLKLVAYRNLAEIGLTGDQIISVAGEKQVVDGPNDQGDLFKRPAGPSDHFVPPFPNDQAARASNNGALPPDLSLIIKARKGGPDYVHSLLTGFKDAPAGAAPVPNGLYYNVAFPGNHVAMPPPLHDNGVTYADGTKATIDQEAQDVVAFLTWASEPELPERHNLGIKVLVFLGVLTILFYIVKLKIWSRVH